MFAVLKRSSGFAAAMLVIGMTGVSAAAGVATPAGVAAGATLASITSIGWKCEGRRCFWQPEYNGPVPPFAAAWGPPDRPTCYYVQRRISKKWRLVCPEVPWQAR